MVTTTQQTMNLKDYINSLSTEVTSEKSLMIEQICKACNVHESTVNRWMNGRSTPDPLKRREISRLTGIPEEELFPDVDKGKVSN